jgi:glycosyltransferase involved in cell wall biosynthesis
MMLSVITPSLNQASFLAGTIRSVLDQSTSFPFELIVVDGGSTDGTVEILRQCTGNIRWITERDSGQSEAVNKGVEMAKGTIIGWLNSDDLYVPGALQKVMDQFILNPDRVWLFGNSMIVNESGQEIRKAITWYKNLKSKRFYPDHLLYENFISQPSVFIRKDAFLQAGGLDTSLHYAMDYDLWLRLTRISNPVVIYEPLSKFRIHKSSKSRKDHRALFREQYRIHKRYDNRYGYLLLHQLHILAICAIYKLINPKT